MTPETHPVVHLIDDDESLRTALSRLLGAMGHKVQTYGSVGDFMLARPDSLRGCMILDVRLPGGPSGLELQNALVRQGESLPIIFLTGHGDIPMGVQAIKNGAFDFLTKPVDREPYSPPSRKRSGTSRKFSTNTHDGGKSASDSSV